jgi:hypothetical protein
MDPIGIKLHDGYQILIAFANNPAIGLWEKSVKPPGLDGGEKIDQTTMHNTVWMTASPQYLIGLTDGTSKVAYDPGAWDDIFEQVNANQSITVHFPDGSALAFFGYLKSFEPDDLVRGTQPEATITVVVTNVDPTTCAESGPIMVPGNGSCTNFT